MAGNYTEKHKVVRLKQCKISYHKPQHLWLLYFIKFPIYPWVINDFTNFWNCKKVSKIITKSKKCFDIFWIKSYLVTTLIVNQNLLFKEIFKYRKIVICTRPLIVPALLVRFLNLLSKIDFWECSKINSTAGTNNDSTVLFISRHFMMIIWI